jgi:Uri superfamily endonuclease
VTNAVNSRIFFYNRLQDQKGSYVLLIQLPLEEAIATGSLKTIHFSAGHYAYVGSALGGLKPRLNRHLRPNKKLHWHIDYLLTKASVRNLILVETPGRFECTIAQALSRRFHSIPNFGASDCRCHSHLFFASEEMTPEIMTVLNSLGTSPTLVRVPLGPDEKQR